MVPIQSPAVAKSMPERGWTPTTGRRGHSRPWRSTPMKAIFAVDNWDCGGTTQFLLYNEVFAEYSDRFIAENLDAIRAGLADS